MRQSAGQKSRFVLPTLVLLLVIIGGILWFRHQQHVRAMQAKYNRYQLLMSLTPLNTAHKQSAPNFTLTDQNGKTVSLSNLRGKLVVLEFMDPACTDICPIVSQEIIEANHLLGAQAAQVEFLAVNVNQYHETQSDVMAFSKEQGLNQLPNWHFLTGDTATLNSIWKSYGIQVVPNPSGDVQHSSFMYFIDQQGTETYLANPDNVKASIPDWAQGINFVIGQMLNH